MLKHGKLAILLVVAGVLMALGQRLAPPLGVALAEILCSKPWPLASAYCANSFIADGSSSPDHDRAIANFNKAIAYRNRGELNYEQKHYDLAIADFMKAIQLEPDTDTYNNLGLAYAGRGDRDDFDHAIENYAEAIKQNSNYPDAHVNLGNLYFGKNEYDAAITEYTIAIELYRNAGAIAGDLRYASAYFDRGNAFRDKSDIPHAIADYKSATELANGRHLPL